MIYSFFLTPKEKILYMLGLPSLQHCISSRLGEKWVEISLFLSIRLERISRMYVPLFKIPERQDDGISLNSPSASPHSTPSKNVLEFSEKFYKRHKKVYFYHDSPRLSMNVKLVKRSMKRIRKGDVHGRERRKKKT